MVTSMFAASLLEDIKKQLAESKTDLDRLDMDSLYPTSLVDWALQITNQTNPPSHRPKGLVDMEYTINYPVHEGRDYVHIQLTPSHITFVDLPPDMSQLQMLSLLRTLKLPEDAPEWVHEIIPESTLVEGTVQTISEALLTRDHTSLYLVMYAGKARVFLRITPSWVEVSKPNFCTEEDFHLALNQLRLGTTAPQWAKESLRRIQESTKERFSLIEYNMEVQLSAKDQEDLVEKHIESIDCVD